MKKIISLVYVASIILFTACSGESASVDYELQERLIQSEIDGLESELNALATSEAYIGIGEIEAKEVDLSTLSYSTLLELMKANRENYIFTIQSYPIDKESDFYNMSYEEQCHFLGERLFIYLGNESKERAVGFGYVPTGDVTVTIEGDNETSITEYTATQTIKITVPIYGKLGDNPIICERVK